MDTIISKLFCDYLSGQSVTSETGYAALAKEALQKEKELRDLLDERQTACFEELFELTSQIHFLEVKDGFYSGCKLGAKTSKELIT